MTVNIKKLLISAVIWSALNAGFVLLLDRLFHNVTGDVIASTVFCMMWVLFAVIFCRRPAAEERDEG